MKYLMCVCVCVCACVLHYSELIKCVILDSSLFLSDKKYKKKLLNAQVSSNQIYLNIKDHELKVAIKTTCKPTFLKLTGNHINGSILTLTFKRGSAYKYIS